MLLHSVADFGDLPMEAVAVVDPERLVEIGGEGGRFTEDLARWAGQHGAEALCIDPVPSAELRELAGATRLQLVEAHSPMALERVGACDLYVVDGDHNYHVVRGELETIGRQAFDAGRDCLVMLHDLAWPCARRDFYYDPDHLPEDAVRPHSFVKGVVPGSEALVEWGGLSGAGAMAIAEQEGGERNGVLTALEDFCAERDGLELSIVPCIYGLGFLFPSKAEWAPALRALLSPHVESPLLARLEANRIALFMRLLELQDELERRRVGFERAIEGYESQLGELAAENLRLKATGK